MLTGNSTNFHIFLTSKIFGPAISIGTRRKSFFEYDYFRPKISLLKNKYAKEKSVTWINSELEENTNCKFREFLLKLSSQ